MYYFYVLRSKKDENLYKGFTSDLDRRLIAHNLGKVFATKSRRPFEVVYTEEFPTKEQALVKERYYKTFKGGKELAKIIDNRE